MRGGHARWAGGAQVDKEDEHNEKVRPHECGREECARGRARDLAGVVVAKGGPEGRPEGASGGEVELSVRKGAKGAGPVLGLEVRHEEVEGDARPKGDGEYQNSLAIRDAQTMSAPSFSFIEKISDSCAAIVSAASARNVRSTSLHPVQPHSPSAAASGASPPPPPPPPPGR